jgi:hypothetical protein
LEQPQTGTGASLSVRHPSRSQSRHL